jgi:hypothetical protein
MHLFMKFSRFSNSSTTLSYFHNNPPKEWAVHNNKRGGKCLGKKAIGLWALLPVMDSVNDKSLKTNPGFKPLPVSNFTSFYAD